MNVAIAGSHGQIALRLARLLTAGGDRVTGLIRNPDHAAEVSRAGASPVLCDLERASVEEIATAIEGADAVVFAAGAAHTLLLWLRPCPPPPGLSALELRFLCPRPGFAAGLAPATNVPRAPPPNCFGCFVSGALSTQPPTRPLCAVSTGPSQLSVDIVGSKSPYAIR